MECVDVSYGLLEEADAGEEICDVDMLVLAVGQSRIAWAIGYAGYPRRSAVEVHVAGPGLTDQSDW